MEDITKRGRPHVLHFRVWEGEEAGHCGAVGVSKGTRTRIWLSQKEDKLLGGTVQSELPPVGLPCGPQEPQPKIQTERQPFPRPITCHCHRWSKGQRCDRGTPEVTGWSPACSVCKPWGCEEPVKSRLCTEAAGGSVEDTHAHHLLFSTRY